MSRSPSAPTARSRPSIRGAPSGPPRSTARRSTASPCVRRSLRTRAVAGGRWDATTRASWCRAPPPTTRSGVPVNWWSRLPTTGSHAGRPTRVPAPRACPTSPRAGICPSACAPSSAAGPSSYGRASDLGGRRGDDLLPGTTCGASPLTWALARKSQVARLLTGDGGGPVGSAESTTGRPTGESFAHASRHRWVRDGVPHRGTVAGSQAQRSRRDEGTFPPVGRCDPGGARALSRQRLSVDPQPAGPRSARRAPGPHPQRKRS
ncbi:hypothetical protein SAM23877_1484 [Streptomyces ambofaciens ATCC 23877]|uniref:Uncharacterized protein n=1 Tax=Streptomyces ambofaciens (strain ATCC 23877 / 3486 / DSM 40053 / JCM 4204 / NBRC 12836 / NRRL B-2516) TaxID=278992 RepID=A0A0K2ANH1_STRA7|nr:hypothetical protein SAM23877_1484 [Streptomyces ambofaciens ATCC 23877]